jgi:hypothetical protein
MEKNEEKPVKPEKKPYEEPTLMEREELIQITEGMAISGDPLKGP